MSRFIFNLHPGQRFCHRCGRPSNLVGDIDVKTGWTGWCKVCNADWHQHDVVSSIRCCSRACSVASPVVCGLGFYIPVAVAVKINMYLYQTGALINILIMRRRKCTLQLLEWTYARLDCILADDSSDELALDDPLTLLSLRYVFLCGRSTDLDHECTLLENVYSFLSPCFKMAYYMQNITRNKKNSGGNCIIAMVDSGFGTMTLHYGSLLINHRAPGTGIIGLWTFRARLLH